MRDSKLLLFPQKIQNPKLRLFCFPFAGGSASTYFPWTEHFSQEIELVFIQLPGRGSRMLEPAHEDMTSLVDELLSCKEQITKVPYLFFGHSLGSRIALELSIQLKQANLALPEYLIASGSRAPHLKSNLAPIYDLPEREFVMELKRLNGTPTEVLENEELMALIMPLLRADFKIADTYQSKQIKMPFPILALHGTDDVDVTLEQVNAWQALSSKELTRAELPGDHFFVHSQYKGVIQHIKGVIDDLLAK